MADGEIAIRFRYFTIILFRAAMVFAEGENYHQIHCALVQAHLLSLYQLHDLPNESVNAGCSKTLSMGLHLTDSCLCTFTHSPVTTPDTRPRNEESGEKDANETYLELILYRLAESLFILLSCESLCCLVVVYGRFMNCCIAMFYSGVTSIDMVQGAFCFPDISLSHLLHSTSGVQSLFQCRLYYTYNALCKFVVCNTQQNRTFPILLSVAFNTFKTTNNNRRT